MPSRAQARTPRRPEARAFAPAATPRGREREGLHRGAARARRGWSIRPARLCRGWREVRAPRRAPRLRARGERPVVGARV